MSTEILGLIAGGFVISAALPQIIRILKTRDTTAISLPMYVMQSIGVILWIIFGFLTSSPAVIITNIIFQVLTLTVLFLKIRHG